jgi:hypothetical protein
MVMQPRFDPPCSTLPIPSSSLGWDFYANASSVRNRFLDTPFALAGSLKMLLTISPALTAKIESKLSLNYTHVSTPVTSHEKQRNGNLHHASSHSTPAGILHSPVPQLPP